MTTRAFLASVVVALLAVSGAADPAPQPFPEIRLVDLTGQNMGLKELRGRVTVLNFWATWCGPCRIELPELQKLLNEFGGKGLVVLAVNVDLPPAQDEEAFAQELVAAKPRLEAFLTASKVTLPVFLADGKSQEMLDLERIPLTVALDGNGGVVRVYSGYSPAGMQDLHEQIGKILAERSKQGGK